MRKLVFLFVLYVTSTLSSIAQEKQISQEDIWGTTFSTKGLDALRSLKSGTQYTVLNREASGISTVDIYDYKTQEKTATLVSSADNEELRGFTTYSLSNDESKILLGTEIEPIFRRSRLGVYFIYDRQNGRVISVAGSKIQEPTFSPDGKKVVYVMNNNLYLFDIAQNKTKQLTTDGIKNKIINGVADWVYEEEFSFVRAYEWNSNGTRLAFLRFDESMVPEFSMDMYGKALYPTATTFKYPKAGEANAVVSLYIYDMTSDRTEHIDTGEAYYIPRIQWMQHPDRLSFQALNRHQDHLQLFAVNASDLTTSLLLDEKDKAYIDITDNLTFLSDDHFIWTSEQDGFNHLYLHSPDGRLLQQLTKGEWEVTKFYGYDRKRSKVYYQSTENGSINRDIYSIDISGNGKKRLSGEEGTNHADFSADFSYFIETYSSSTTPPVYTLNDALTGKELNVIRDNAELLNTLGDYELSPKEFSTISVNGEELNMYMIKPRDFDPSREYPLLMYQYSGPGSQNVSNSWMLSNDYWHQMLASQGVVIVCVDGRGTGFKGRDFKKVTQKELGKYELEDQIAAAEKLSELPYIDEKRTGIWGWSFGGFMATNSILKGSATFETAIAVAPVTNWRFYDTIYTERYMQTPQENPGGYDENSPLNYPELLEGNYLLVHGSGDDNVHVQNTMRMVEALVQANKPFEWAVYPDKSHGISGGNTRTHLYSKMTRFIKDHLGGPGEKKTDLKEKQMIKG